MHTRIFVIDKNENIEALVVSKISIREIGRLSFLISLECTSLLVGREEEEGRVWSPLNDKYSWKKR